MEKKINRLIPPREWDLSYKEEDDLKTVNTLSFHPLNLPLPMVGQLMAVKDLMGRLLIHKSSTSTRNSEGTKKYLVCFVLEAILGGGQILTERLQLLILLLQEPLLLRGDLRAQLHLQGDQSRRFSFPPTALHTLHQVKFTFPPNRIAHTTPSQVKSNNNSPKYTTRFLAQ